MMQHSGDASKKYDPVIWTFNGGAEFVRLPVLGSAQKLASRFQHIVNQLALLEREGGSNEESVIIAADARRQEVLVLLTPQAEHLLRALHAHEKRWSARLAYLQGLLKLNVPAADQELYARAEAHYRIALKNVTKLLEREHELRTLHNKLARWSELRPLPSTATDSTDL